MAYELADNGMNFSNMVVEAEAHQRDSHRKFLLLRMFFGKRHEARGEKGLNNIEHIFFLMCVCGGGGWEIFSFLFGPFCLFVYLKH